MLRKSYILYLFVLLLVLGCSREDDTPPIILNYFEGQLEFTGLYGGSEDDMARAVIPTLDGGYAILGSTYSSDGDLTGLNKGSADYWLLKFNTENELEWQRTFGGSGEDLGQSLVQSIDGGFALTGYAESADGDGSNNEGFHDNWVLKTDANGMLLWERSFGFSGHDHSYDILENADGQLFFTGFLDITSARADGYDEKGNTLTRHGVGEFWGTRLDPNGNLLWRSYFGGSNNDRAHAVVSGFDGGYVMAGFSESDDFDISNSNGSYDYWVVAVNDAGELLWERSFGGSGIDIASDISRTPDGGYILVGHAFSTDGDISGPKGEADVWVVKIDASGILEWETSIGGSGFDAAESISPSGDGGYFITGNSRSSDNQLTANAGENDLWVLKIDSKGALQWQTSFGNTGIDMGFDATLLADGSLLVVGEMEDPSGAQTGHRGKKDLVVLRYR